MALELGGTHGTHPSPDNAVRRGRVPCNARAGHRIVRRIGQAFVVAGVLLLAGVAVARLVVREPGPRAERPAPGWQARQTELLEATIPRTDVPARRRARVARPTRIRIPALGVNAPIVRLGLDGAGALEVPEDFAEAGWWSGGARPGQRGPAVIAGHVDSRTGPAVFFRLRELRVGDSITIGRADGSRVRFRVTRSEHHWKTHFPTAKVYGPTAVPTLRMITCSGAFDHATGHYLDNTVVYARVDR